MTKLVTCCVCGRQMPLQEAVASGYALAQWPHEPPVTLYACKGQRCQVEAMQEMERKGVRERCAPGQAPGPASSPARARSHPPL